MLFQLRSLLALACLAASACLLSSCASGPASINPGGFSTVVIDAGHGGHDSGERSHGLAEKNLTLDTALRLQPLLRRAGFQTVMSRTGDYFVELDDRVALANRYPNAILVSIHYNASGSGAPRGAQTYFWQRDSYGLSLRVQRSLVQATGLENRGITRRVLRLTHNPRIPSILCECGFLTNGGDAALVSSADFRQRVAEGLAKGIAEERAQGDIGLGELPPIAVAPAPVTHHRHRSGGSRHRAGGSRHRANADRHHTRRHRRS